MGIFGGIIAIIIGLFAIWVGATDQLGLMPK